MTGVRLCGVAKRFRDTDVLTGIDLDVRDGELMTVLGPSGCGKTTLLRLVAGLETVTGGRIEIGNRDVTALPPGERNVSMVFQSYALFPHLTVADNIAFGLRARGVARATCRERTRAAAELTECAHLLDRRPPTLSGGERQRVALARALVREPDVFLLDEPLSNLDAELRAQTRAELKSLHARVGGTMLYVTHDQLEALTLGDRVAVLRDGAIQQIAAPDELWRTPANAFVARFVGFPGMNLLSSGAIVGRTVPAGMLLGVRPEHVLLGAEGEPAVVHLVEPVGAEALVHLVSGGDRLVARVPSETRPAVGDTVRLGVRPEHLHLFDAADGARRDHP